MKLDLPPKLWDWLLSNKGNKSVQAYVVGVLVEHSETKDTNGENNDEEHKTTREILHKS